MVITTPEMLVTEDFLELTAVQWEVLVVDEAHRLKNHTSKLASNLRHERFHFGSTLLLTGTPIQNNMNEMWTLLNIVDPDKFDDVGEFLEKYGDMKSKERVDELHESIRPYILRRLKEDVEKSVPPKERDAHRGRAHSSAEAILSRSVREECSVLAPQPEEGPRWSQHQQPGDAASKVLQSPVPSPGRGRGTEGQ